MEHQGQLTQERGAERQCTRKARGGAPQRFGTTLPRHLRCEHNPQRCKVEVRLGYLAGAETRRTEPDDREQQKGGEMGVGPT